MTSNPQWWFEFERQESLRMERSEAASDRLREHYAERERPQPTPPFLPGDLIIPIAHPESGAVTVCVMVDHSGEWRVGWRGSRGITGSAPASQFVLAPENWIDAPPQPGRHIQLGLTEADRQAALREDEADAELQAALARWTIERRAWDATFGQHPAILKAREARDQAELFMARARGETP